MAPWEVGAFLALCALLTVGFLLALRQAERARRLRRTIESAGYEMVHGANAIRAHLIALEQEGLPLPCAPHLNEIRRALERFERAAAILAEALRPESAGVPGSSSAGTLRDRA